VHDQKYRVIADAVVRLHDRNTSRGLSLYKAPLF
jgi:hypothetical protein